MVGGEVGLMVCILSILWLLSVKLAFSSYQPPPIGTKDTIYRA